jgi:hypothetical protein
MMIFQYVASIALFFLGILIAFTNAWILICQLRGRRSPSVVPIIGGIFLCTGGIIFPGGLLRTWAVLGLFLDYGCMPYLIFVSIYLIREEIRYAARNRLLTLEYVTSMIKGEFAVYPRNECIHKWNAKDGMSSGSMVMKVDEYIIDSLLRISLQDINIEIHKTNGEWSVAKENGWHDSMHSIENSQISEKAANNANSADAKSRAAD